VIGIYSLYNQNSGHLFHSDIYNHSNFLFSNVYIDDGVLQLHLLKWYPSC